MAPRIVGFVSGIICAIISFVLGASWWMVFLTYCNTGAIGMMAHAIWIGIFEPKLSDNHPAWAAIYSAITAAREGDAKALDTIEREVSRLHDEASKAS